LGGSAVLSAALKMLGAGRQPALAPALDAPPQLESASELEPDSPGDASPTCKPRIARIWIHGHEDPPQRLPTPEEDARRLLRWVTKNGYGGKLVLAMDLQRIYPRMCEQLGRSAFAWQQVAEPLKELTGGKKRYEWIRLTPGKRKKDRRRVYLIPSAM
jgi:hypothetical protein